MEAGATLRGTGVSNRIVAIVAVMALGAGAAVLTRGVSGSIAAPVPGVAQVKSSVGSAWSYSVRRGGTQSVEGSADSTSGSAPTFRENHGH